MKRLINHVRDIQRLRKIMVKKKKKDKTDECSLKIFYCIHRIKTIMRRNLTLVQRKLNYIDGNAICPTRRVIAITYSAWWWWRWWGGEKILSVRFIYLFSIGIFTITRNNGFLISRYNNIHEKRAASLDSRAVISII